MKLNHLITTLLVLLASWSTIWANPKVSTKVNSNKIGIDDILVVTYSFKNARNLESVQLPKYSNFIQIGVQQSNQNNQEYECSVSLQPTSTGTFIIPGIISKSNGSTHKSAAIKIEVVKGSILKNSRNNSSVRNSRMQQIEEDFKRMDRMMREMMGGDEDIDEWMKKMAQRQRQIMEANRRAYQQRMNPTNINENLYIKATVDKTNIYFGQDITVTYKLYNRVGFSQGNITKIPELKGFYSKDFDIPIPPKEEVETVNGKPFSTFLIKKAKLTPTKTGALTLDPMEFTATSQYFGEVKVKSQPITINVAPIPEKNTPESYTGGVGQFKVASKLSTEKFTTDDIATLSFTITGTGNTDLITAPKIKFPEFIEATEGTASANAKANSSNVTSKTFTYQLSASKKGDYQIPNIEFSFFDPNKGQFITTATPEINFNVADGQLQPTTEKRTKTVKRKKALDIINSKLPLASKHRPLSEHPVFWGLLALLLTTVPVLAFFRKKQDQKSFSSIRKQQANKIALKRLKKARALLNSPNDKAFYEEVSKSIWLYFSDKLHIPISDLNKEQIRTTLLQKNTNSALIEKIQNTIKECEIALYSPMGGLQQKNQVLKQATEAISDFENHFKKS